MSILIDRIGADRLAEYASIPMICEVRSILMVDELDGGMGGLGFREQAVNVPYIKDYDSYLDGGPLQWPARFDMSRWGMWIATEAGKPIAGAAVALGTPGIDMPEPSNDLAVLWDIRVNASSRLKGVGSALFRNAARWAKSAGCRLMKIETQNVNVVACRFYQKRGCSLGRIDRMAYRNQPQITGEVMLVWYRDLARPFDNGQLERSHHS